MGLDVGYERNVGGIDRIVRAVLAVALLGGGGVALAMGETLAAAAMGLAGVAFGVNAVTGFCIANRLLGIDTCSWEPDST